MERAKKIALISTIVIVLLGTSVVVPYILYKNFSKQPPINFLGYANYSHSVPNGSIYNTSEGLVIMELSGTYAQMGYAHGQLIGQFIKYSIEYIVKGVLDGNTENYNEIYDLVELYANKSIEMHSEEIEGIHAGAIESGYDLYVPSLKRSWTINDLWVLNTIQDWNQYYCSGFGAWGTSTNTSLNGRTIIGRDLDFRVDPNGYITQIYTIIIYHGSDERNTILSFAWPGVITCITAFNEKGVWLSTNNSNGQTTEVEGRTPMGIAMRNFLEQEDGINVTDDAISFFLAMKPYAPFLFLLGSNETTTNPVVVLEGNNNEVIARTGTSEGNEYVFLTNHQRVLMLPQTDCKRYNKYVTNFQEFITTGDKAISIDEALFMLKDSSAGTLTINCVLFFPDTLEFRIGYTRVIDQSNSYSLRGGPDDPLLLISFKLI